MTNPNNSIDSGDIVIAVALWGGFETGNWLPFIILTILIGFYNLEKSKRDKDEA